MKKSVSAAILALIILLASAGYFILNQGSAPAEDVTAQIGDMRLNPAGIALEYADERHEFIFMEGAWYYAYDLDFPVNQNKLIGMITALKSLSSDVKVDAKLENLGEYGLDPPRLTITAAGEDGRERVYAVGDYNSYNNMVYFMADGGVYMIGKGSAGKLLLYLDDLLDADRFPYIDVDRVKSFTLWRDGVTLRIEPNGDGYLVNGEPGDRDRCYEVLKSACSLYSFGCADYRGDLEALVAHGLTPSRAVVTIFYTVWGDNETVHELTIYFGDDSPDGYTYARMAHSDMVLKVAYSEARIIITARAEDLSEGGAE